VSSLTFEIVILMSLLETSLWVLKKGSSLVSRGQSQQEQDRFSLRQTYGRHWDVRKLERRRKDRLNG
jgi:hypothetical protein